MAQMANTLPGPPEVSSSWCASSLEYSSTWETRKQQRGASQVRWRNGATTGVLDKVWDMQQPSAVCLCSRTCTARQTCTEGRFTVR